MNAGTVTPDFQRTVNIYDGQGGTQPLQLSFVKTAANTWAYEVSYQGDAANIGGAANNPIYERHDDVQSGRHARQCRHLGLAGQRHDLADPALGPAASGLTRRRSASTWARSTARTASRSSTAPRRRSRRQVDGALFGSLSGVSVDTEGYVTAQFTNGLTQKIYKLPVATFANPDGLAAVSGNAYATSQRFRHAHDQRSEHRRRRHDQVEVARRFDGRSGDRVYQSDHDAARVCRVRPHRDNRIDDAGPACCRSCINEYCRCASAKSAPADPRFIQLD